MNKKIVAFSFLFMSLFFVDVFGKKVKAKKLTHRMVSLLESELKKQPPVAAAHLVQALENTKKAVSGLESDKRTILARKPDLSDKEINLLEDKLVQKKYLRFVIKDVQHFFEGVHDNQELLKPIIDESFAGIVSNSESFIQRFLAVPKSEAQAFFETTVKSKEDLVNICFEFEQLFSDLNETMPNEFKRGRDFLEDRKKELKNKK